ncbi:transposase [Dactylosporangium sp. NPDC049742]|uniref:transposase n=1 Tax=Dactylosporangium sp. NPDC049742 TaxID=3154737 RepID=UPI00341AE635
MQWQRIEPFLPAPACQTPTGGRPERHHRRAVLDAIFYLVDNGIKWRALPADFPPWRTVYGLFARWSDNLSTIELADKLRADLRVALGRNPQPSAGCIDSQSIHESAEGIVPTATSGYDSYKRVNGRKRQREHSRVQPAHQVTARRRRPTAATDLVRSSSAWSICLPTGVS